MNQRLTVNIKEAAEILGFEGTYHLRLKTKAGKIPGAFKVSNKWMYVVAELLNMACNFHKTLGNDINNKKSKWHSTKDQAAHTILRGSQFRELELECANQLSALQKETRKNMKTNGSEN